MTKSIEEQEKEALRIRADERASLERAGLTRENLFDNDEFSDLSLSDQIHIFGLFHPIFNCMGGDDRVSTYCYYASLAAEKKLSLP